MKRLKLQSLAIKYEIISLHIDDDWSFCLICLNHLFQICSNFVCMNLALTELRKLCFQISHSLIGDVSVQVTFGLGSRLECIFYLGGILSGVLIDSCSSYHLFQFKIGLDSNFLQFIILTFIDHPLVVIQIFVLLVAARTLGFLWSYNLLFLHQPLFTPCIFVLILAVIFLIVFVIVFLGVLHSFTLLFCHFLVLFAMLAVVRKIFVKESGLESAKKKMDIFCYGTIL